MNWLLAEDGIVKIPAPPGTTDPITWITIALVLMLIYILTVQAPNERAISRREFFSSLAAVTQEHSAAMKQLGDDFKELLTAEREQRVELGARITDGLGEIHDRVTGLTEKLVRGDGCANRDQHRQKD